MNTREREQIIQFCGMIKFEENHQKLILLLRELNGLLECKTAPLRPDEEQQPV